MEKLLRDLILITVLMACLEDNLYGQQPSPEKTNLLQRSGSNKQTGWILLAAGGVGTITGLAAMPRADFLDGEVWPFFAITGGVVSSLLSIPFFIKASNQSARAARLSVIPVSPDLHDRGIVSVQLPSIRVRIGP